MKTVYFFISLGIIFVTIFIVYPQLKQHEERVPTVLIKEKETTKPPEKNSSLFVPYWTINTVESDDQLNQLNQYERIIYFGIEADKLGIRSYGLGVKSLEKLKAKIPKDKKRWLTVIMTNTDENIKILGNLDTQKKVISETIDIVEKYQFQGVVLDLEMGFLPFDNVVAQLNDFVKEFSTEVHEKNLKFAMTIYGDTFYRKRPYDIKTLNNFVDEMMIMAYNFHKSRGEPGPNFPLARRSLYDYDFKTMIKDFLQFVPSEKLTVIFGMYGYDWLVDEKKRPLNQANALTLKEIKANFLDRCQWQDCVVNRDNLSKETEINYVKSEIINNFATLYYHIVWFEDEQSAAVKQKYLLEKGIGSVGYWAYGYY